MRLLVDHDLGKGEHAGPQRELRAAVRVLCQIDFLVFDPAALEQHLGARALRAVVGRVDGDASYFRKYSIGAWAGSVKTEAIVLRSIRYGEADRILHLYTPRHGRIGAIAKGARRSRSRFGARLEPFFRIQAVLHDGRGDLLTVTGRRHRGAHASLREHAASARRRGARLRCRRAAVRDARPAPGGVQPAGQRAGAAERRARAGPGRPNGLAFRLKLLLAAGIVPQLASCAACGEARAPAGLLRRGRRGGLQLVRGRRRSPSSEEAYGFLVGALSDRWPTSRRPRSGRCAKPSGRSSRRPSITPTSGCGRCCTRRQPPRCDAASPS